MVSELRDERARSLLRLEALSRLMDGAVVLPGTGVRVGLDALLGLVPGIGDLAGAVISGYLVLEARKLGAPNALVSRMIGNIIIDTVVGAVPVVGDLFDVAFRANMKNMALLRTHMDSVRSSLRYGRVIDGEFSRMG